jgi:hypothetical protein
LSHDARSPTHPTRRDECKATDFGEIREKWCVASMFFRSLPQSRHDRKADMITGLPAPSVPNLDEP